jgi:transposase
MSLKAKQVLGVNKLQVVADNGYYSGKEIYDCERNHIEVYVPEKDKVQFRNEKRFGKSDFRYNKSRDTYTCPKGNKLHYSHTEKVKNRKVIDTVRIYRANGCNRCSLKPQCTKHKWGKRLQRREYESILEKVRQRLRGNGEKYALRMQLVEHPFGTLKRWMNMGYFLTKGLSGVRAESSLSCLVYNMKRVFNIVDMPTLIAAVS